MKKIVVIPDLHLTGTNYGLHKDCLTESIELLDRLKTFLTNQNPDIVIIGGDFFHTAKEDNLLLLSHVTSWLYTIGNKCDIYAIKGNHEISRQKKYSTYDFIINSGITKQQKKLSIDNVDIHLIDYSRDKENYKRELYKDKVNIGIFHDNIVDVSVVNDFIGDTISPDEVQGLTAAYDYMIINHIHNPIGKYYRNISNKEVEIIIPGSIGRTDSREVHLRNFAKIPVITINNNDVTIELENFDLINYEEIFDLSEKYEVALSFDKAKLAVDYFIKDFEPITSPENDLKTYITQETPQHLLRKMYEYLGWN